MTVAVHTGVVHGKDQLTSAIVKVQSALGMTTYKAIDGQHLAAQIIALQQKLVSLGKMSASQVNKTIDDQHLSAKLVAVEAIAAANGY